MKGKVQITEPESKATLDDPKGIVELLLASDEDFRDEFFVSLNKFLKKKETLQDNLKLPVAHS